MKRLLIFIFVLSGHICYTQNSDFKEISEIVDNMPSKQEKSIKAIANYIKSNFQNPDDQLKAAFYWTATNIDYAVEDIRRGTTYKSTEQLINISMRSRRGVCQAYAEIFNEIALQLNFESYVISGYVRQNGVVGINYGHAWNAVEIGKKWYLFDATWAAGHFLFSDSNRIRSKSNYIKKFTPKYFKVNPEEFIKSHMPFDPLWQISDQIINYKAFDKSQFQKGFRAGFNYEKIIAKLTSGSEMDHFKNSIVRVESLGKGNRLVRNYLDILKRNLEIANTNADGETYNRALAYHSEGINFFNDYVDLYNQHKYRVKNKSKQLSKLLDHSFKASYEAQNIYESISTNNSTLQLNIKIKKGELEELLEKIEEEKQYLKKQK